MHTRVHHTGTGVCDIVWRGAGRQRDAPPCNVPGWFFQQQQSSRHDYIQHSCSTHSVLLAPPLPALLLLLLQALHGLLLLLPPLLRCLLVQPHPCSVLCRASSLPLRSVQHSMPGSFGTHYHHQQDTLTPCNSTHTGLPLLTMPDPTQHHSAVTQ